MGANDESQECVGGSYVRLASDMFVQNSLMMIPAGFLPRVWPYQIMNLCPNGRCEPLRIRLKKDSRAVQCDCA